MASRHIIALCNELLDSEFNNDLTCINDEGKVIIRGEVIYKRPCGWYRIALKVKGKYESDDWLGLPGYRAESSPGEWPVSFHGTTKKGAIEIGQIGYQEWQKEKGKSMPYGKGHYSTPDIEVAARYAQPFEVEGKRYLAVIQNRVNLKKSSLISKELTGAGADYYVTPSSDDLRAYGICFKEI